MATFGGLTFRLLVSSPGLGQQALYEETPIPGGTPVVDFAGAQAARFRGAVVLDSFADYLSLLGALGTLGVLAYSEESFNARLVSAVRTRVMPSGKQFADVEFLILGVYAP